MKSNNKCSNDQNNVPVVLKVYKPENEGRVTKTYRVTLSVNMLMDVDVQADSKAMAEGIIFDWDAMSTCGHDRVGSFCWFGDDGKEYREDDGGDLFWEVVAEADNDEIHEIIELGDGDGEETPKELTS